MPFQQLQNGLYNVMTEALGLTKANNFQLIQPAVSFQNPHTDASVWQWMNEIPPAKLIASGSGGNQFFSDYETVVSALKPSIAINFAADIGQAANDAWMRYLAGLRPVPNPAQQPSLFYNWAFAHGFYSVADVGATDLSAMNLEPIHRAHLALAPYQKVPGVSQGRSPDWSLGYPQLVGELASAPKRSYQTSDVQSKSNVVGAWTVEDSGGGFLFFGGGGSSNSLAIGTSFASKAVSLSVAFDHVLNFVPVPGPWYDSSAFGLAYASQNNGAPWNPAVPLVTWAKTFGPSGNMQWFTGSLIAVSGMHLTAKTSQAFSAAEQATINQNSGVGIWPFYASGGASSITTGHSFDQKGHLTITSSSAANVPILIGRTVMPAAQYVGHAVAGRHLFLELSSKLPKVA
jgi:hypothetical protein